MVTMHLFHRWRDVQPDGKKPPPGVRYQQCTRSGCAARRVLDTLRGGYRGGGLQEDEWIRPGVMPELKPPPRGPRGSGGIPAPPKRVEVHVYHHHHESERP